MIIIVGDEIQGFPVRKLKVGYCVETPFGKYRVRYGTSRIGHFYPKFWYVESPIKWGSISRKTEKGALAALERELKELVTLCKETVERH